MKDLYKYGKSMKESIQANRSNTISLQMAIEEYFNDNNLDCEIVNYDFGNDFYVEWDFECEGEDFKYIDDDVLYNYIEDVKEFRNENFEVFSYGNNIQIRLTDEFEESKKSTRKSMSENINAFDKAIAKKYNGTESNGAGQYYLDWRFDLKDEMDNIEMLADKYNVKVEFQSDDGYFEVFEESIKESKSDLLADIQNLISSSGLLDSIADVEDTLEIAYMIAERLDPSDYGFKDEDALANKINFELKYDREYAKLFESKKSMKESKKSFEEFEDICYDNFSFAIDHTHQYKGAYFVVVYGDERQTEKFAKILRNNGFETTWYRLNDPHHENYLCYEIMAI